MKFGVVVFPGSNCDRDALYAAALVEDAETLPVWHKDADLPAGLDCIILPGGFSYGDYLRSGAIARFSPIMSRVIDFANKGGMVLGICNGFQVLCEAGLLPGALLRNASLRFVCRPVYVRAENTETAFTNVLAHSEVLRIPVAHGEGNYYADPATIEALEQENRVVFRYCEADGGITAEANPNGSLNNIAGIINKQGNVMGLMPHPERAGDALLGSADGLKIFESIARHCLSTAQ